MTKLRAKGIARNNSDIDLAVYGIDDELRVEGIAMELDALPLPLSLTRRCYFAEA